MKDKHISPEDARFLREMNKKPGLEHPCRDTCSGWKQGYGRGQEEMRSQLQAKSAEAERLGKEIEVYGRFAEKFGDLSCCYDAEDVTSVIASALSESQARVKVLEEHKRLLFEENGRLLEEKESGIWDASHPLRQRVKVLEDGLADALELMGHGDFRNGNTDEFGMIDEGLVRMGQRHSNLEKILAGSSSPAQGKEGGSK